MAIVAAIVAIVAAIVAALPRLLTPDLSTISLPLAIPAVIVIVPAARARPVAADVHAASVVGLDPVRARVRRSRPVPGMPRIMPSRRIPVAFDPHDLRPGPRRDAVEARGRRRLDINGRGLLDFDNRGRRGLLDHSGRGAADHDPHRTLRMNGRHGADDQRTRQWTDDPDSH